MVKFNYRCCFSCRFLSRCIRKHVFEMHEEWDMWEIAQLCSFYLPRKLSLLEKMIIIAAWLLR